MKNPSSVQGLASSVQGPESVNLSSDPRPQTLDSRLSQRWLCLSVVVPQEAAEGVANFLIELGSSGVVEGTKDLTQPPAFTTEVQGFFPIEASGSSLHYALVRYLTELSEVFPSLGHPTPRLTEVTSDAWQDRWREHFPPIQIGKRFLLLPPWEPSPPETSRMVIVIEPSMAFGTGHHVTTQGCLEAIERLYDRDGVPDRALDLGTGSGILAIALAKLGTLTVWATDIDPVAVEEARKNIALNQVAPFIQLSNSPIEHLPTPFSLIVANLFSTTLLALARAMGTAVEPQGYAILSGIQLEQETEVRAVYSPPLWYLSARIVQDEWATLILQRSDTCPCSLRSE